MKRIKKKDPVSGKQADSGPFYFDFDAGFTNHFAEGWCCRQPKLWRQKGFCPLCPHCPGYRGIPPTEFCENLHDPLCRSAAGMLPEI